MKFYTNVQYDRGNILYRGYDNGSRVQEKIKYKPTLYLPSNDEDSIYKNIDGQKVEPKNFKSVWDAQSFISDYENVDNFSIYGFTRWHYSYIYEQNFTKEFDFEKIKIFNVDIEVDSKDGFPEPSLAEKEITSITIGYKKKYIVLGCKEYKEHKENVKYIKCTDEYSLLRNFIKIYQKIDPDIITGWNVKFFDMVYIYNRLINLFDIEYANCLSPWGNVISKKSFKNNREEEYFEFVGITILDYMELYKKYARPIQSYRLDYVGDYELGVKKIQYDGSLHQLYEDDYQKFIEYNIRDVEIVDLLEEKKKYIFMVLTIAYEAQVNMDDPLSQVRLWDVMIHNYLMNRRIVVPMQKSTAKNRKYEGGYVKEPIPGKYSWTVSFDLVSMYPSLIRMFSIGPDTLIKDKRANIEVNNLLFKDDIWKDALKTAKENDYSLAANGCYYKHKKSFLSEMMENLMTERKEYKDKMKATKAEIEKYKSQNKDYKDLEIESERYDALQLSKKVCLNSAYGAMGNQYFRFYDIKNATAITLSGRLAIRWVEKYVNEYLNDFLNTNNIDYIIAVDTDSIYVNMEKIVDKFCKNMNMEEKIDFLDNFCDEKMQPIIDDIYDNLKNSVNAYEQQMHMKREVIASTAIWQAKKRYALDVWDDEGVRKKDPDLKIMGVEAIKSSTPSICRKQLKNAISIILRKNEEDLQKYILECKKEFMNAHIDEISSPISINGLDKYHDNDNIYSKGTPIQVKGALSYNNLLKKYNLEGKYDKILNGNKILFCRLQDPNPTKINVISFTDQLPKEFNLYDYIDYDLQFKVAFIQPLEAIIKHLGWNAYYKPNLEDIFE